MGTLNRRLPGPQSLVESISAKAFPFTNEICLPLALCICRILLLSRQLSSMDATESLRLTYGRNIPREWPPSRSRRLGSPNGVSLTMRPACQLTSTVPLYATDSASSCVTPISLPTCSPLLRVSLRLSPTDVLRSLVYPKCGTDIFCKRRLSADRAFHSPLSPRRFQARLTHYTVPLLLDVRSSVRG